MNDYFLSFIKYIKYINRPVFTKKVNNMLDTRDNLMDELNEIGLTYEDYVNLAELVPNEELDDLLVGEVDEQIKALCEYINKDSRLPKRYKLFVKDYNGDDNSISIPDRDL